VTIVNTRPVDEVQSSSGEENVQCLTSHSPIRFLKHTGGPLLTTDDASSLSRLVVKDPLAF